MHQRSLLTVSSAALARSINALLLKRYDLNQFFRYVIKQLQDEMFQQGWSVSSCMGTHNAMEEHYTGCQHSMPFVLNGPTQLFL
jgi:hypothetical protein